jgi:hypothetical protein
VGMMKMSRFFISLIVLFFFISLNSFSQTKNQTAEDLAVKLQQKVLLSKDQTNKVTDILTAYFKNSNQTSLENAKKSVESILDKRQKAKYDIIKNDWWSAVQKEAVKAVN